MRTRTAPRKKNLLEPVFSVNYFPGHKFHYKSQATPGIRTRRNELLQVESHPAAPDHVSSQSGAGGVLPHAQVTRLRPGTGRPSVAEDGRVRRPCPNHRESAAKSLRSARVSRPRRSTDRRSPGDAPTAGDGGRRGRAGQETLPEPARMRQPQVTAIGQSDPLPRTPHGQWSDSRQMFGVVPPGLGRAGDDCSFLARGLRHQPTICPPIRVLAERREITLHASRSTPHAPRLTLHAPRSTPIATGHVAKTGDRPHPAKP